MSDKTKNGVIIVLVCVIAILVCIIAFVLGMKLADKENEAIDESNNEVKADEKIVSYVEEKDGVPYITLNGFEAQNNEIKEFYGTNNTSVDYTYHVFKNVLFVNILKNVLHGQEGRIYYLNYYVDLSNNKILKAKDVLSKLNVSMDDFNRQCVGCTLDDTLDSLVRLMPTGSLIYVDTMDMAGNFDSFKVGMSK